MKTRLTAVAVGVMTALSAGLTTTPAHADETTYYVAVGDSLSVGAQPGKGPTDEGYTDNLYAALKAKNPGLKLVKLGCGGETTSTMLNGGICTYSEGSQMKAAEAFLSQHKAQVRYVTLDVGANDTACFLDGDIACGLKGIGTIITNLPQIATRLKKAGGDAPTYAAMTYYDPGLATWVTGGQAIAIASVPLVDVFNTWEQTVYRVGGFKVADVNATFATHDFATKVTLPTYGEIPLNVARICTWTYQCAKNDGHATPEGYRQIADTFLLAVS
ncbi:SGNH/GDSL hydrolase family protein [Actinomadura barringtoniae]|uniref:SGNH/GDSL hydrolase family protein n=1 Tax=Actinomadura barringtoniae TaxID=1427535 RepID=A0A939PJF1_9ACTN|nr:SGNH/GDSL hydrolase family protein [Actinomadura barringtoniae]MBO2454002.1 SGNH/GDSL hydrolase family protein [Actinomadura barringtoniae]